VPLTLRIAVRFAYDGMAFDSYARQPDRRTVEGALVEALAREGLVDGSFRTGSRTDAGVSALANVAAATLDRGHLRGLVPALVRHLPQGVWVTQVAPAPEGWDPRKAAWRHYRLRMLDGGEDEARMAAALAAFVGTHDVSAFARVEANRTPQRTVLSGTVQRDDGLWRFDVRGESFLWGQVRRMVGAALAVGRGEAEPGDVTRSLASGKPHARFTPAPAEGLVLVEAHHPGLAWAPEAGRLPPGMAEAWVAARSRLDVARHVADASRAGDGA